MHTVRSRVFVVLFCLVLASPLALFCAQKVVKADLPAWLTAEESQYLSGGSSTGAADLRSTMTLAGFASGLFQTTLDEHLSSYIPCKSLALLGNAAAQRAAIAASNVLFGWDCYPCYYGNDGYVAFPSRSMVVPRTQTSNEANAQAAAQLVGAINRAAEKYPDVTFVYQQVDDTYTSAANPSSDLITGVYTVDWVEENITGRLDDGVQVLWETIDSPDDLAEDWFSTEHHWTMLRAVEAYNDLAAALGWDAVDEDTPNEVVAEWYGTSARFGLDLDYSSSLYDIDRGEEFLSLAYSQNGEACDRGLWNAVFRGEPVDLDSLLVRYNAYHMYFGYPVTEGVYTNSGENNGKTCLVIEQSYGVPIEPLIALNYATTIVIDPINGNVEKTLEEYLEDYEVDDVVVQLGTRDLYSGATRSPVFFEG